MKRKAYGKLNLGLRVIGKRADGYHDLEMVMVPVDLFDSIELIPSHQLTIKTDKWYLPLDERNTVYKAILLMGQLYNISTNYEVNLIKNIPTQAGMAGGSTDAACVINMLDELHQLNLSDQQKIDVAKQIGADVPFCLFEKPALVTGIGEKLEFIDIKSEFFLFLIKPNFGISTKQLFSQFKLGQNSKPIFDELLQGLTTGDYSKVAKNLVNDLQPSSELVNGQIKEICQELVNFGFDNACMTGSGSVVFGITQDETLVDNAVVAFVNKYPLVKKSQIVFKNV